MKHIWRFDVRAETMAALKEWVRSGSCRLHTAVMSSMDPTAACNPLRKLEISFTTIWFFSVLIFFLLLYLASCSCIVHFFFTNFCSYFLFYTRWDKTYIQWRSALAYMFQALLHNMNTGRSSHLKSKQASNRSVDADWFSLNRFQL